MSYVKLTVLSLAAVSVLLLGQTAARAESDLKIEDVTERFTYKYENVLSAFGDVFQRVPVQENAAIIKVFHFLSPFDLAKLDSQDFARKRVEVMCTGGDWMEYAYVVFVTDADQVKMKDGRPVGYWNPNEPFTYPDPRAYFIRDLSTADFEEGTVAPVINIFNESGIDSEMLRSYITEKFLDKDGRVNSSFVPLCAGMRRGEYPCEKTPYSK